MGGFWRGRAGEGRGGENLCLVHYSLGKGSEGLAVCCALVLMLAGELCTY